MFIYKIRAGHFLEWQKVFKYYYGTPLRKVKELLKKGRYVLLCIDVKGAKVVWRQFPQALKIFIRPPSLAVLKARLIKRGTENSQDLKIRMQTAKRELLEAPHYDLIVTNGDLHEAYNKIKRFLAARM
jgi:guanylate kinase